MSCNHHWIKDGEFRHNRQMWSGLRAHVTCARCNGRTWMTVEQWKAAKKAVQSNTGAEQGGKDKEE